MVKISSEIMCVCFLHLFIVMYLEESNFFFFSHSIPEGKVGCYYCRFQQESLLEMATLESDINAPEYVICFLGGSEKGLELYPYL